MKVIGITLLVIVGMIIFGALGTALNLFTIPWLKFSRQVQMNRDIVEKTYNADNALYNYHWFKEKAGSIEATKNKILIAQTDLSEFQALAGDRFKWTFDDKQEESRLRTVLTGLKNFYEDQVTEYNARANQADRAIFKDELPLFFSLDAY